LMTYLPAFEPSDIASKGDIRDFKKDVNEQFAAIDRRFDELGERIDRVLLTLAAGLFVIVAAVIGLIGVVLAAV
jgi:hypothetical protein